MKKFAIIVALMILPLVNAEVFPNQYQNSGYVGWVHQDFLVIRETIVVN